MAFVIRVWLYIEGVEQVNFRGILDWLTDDLWEILLVGMNGMNDNDPFLNVPAWTLSAMLISEFLIYSLLCNCEKLFYTLICPCVIVFGFGFWRHIPSADHDIWIGYTTFGLLRVLILNCLAWYCWMLIKKIRGNEFTRTGKAVLTICEILMYAAIIYIIMNFSSRNYRWTATLLMFLAIAISISGVSYTNNLLPAGKFTSWLGEVSMGIYLTHYPIMRVYRHIWKDPAEMFSHKLSFGIVVMASAVVFCIIVRYSSKAAAKIKSVICEKCVQRTGAE